MGTRSGTLRRWTSGCHQMEGMLEPRRESRTEEDGKGASEEPTECSGEGGKAEGTRLRARQPPDPGRALAPLATDKMHLSAALGNRTALSLPRWAAGQVYLPAS